MADQNKEKIIHVVLMGKTRQEVNHRIISSRSNEAKKSGDRMDLYKMLRSAGKSSGIRNDYMLWMEKFVTHSDEVE